MWVALGRRTHLLNTGVCKMRSWSSFVLFIAVLMPIGTVHANSAGLIQVDQGFATIDRAATALLNGTLGALIDAHVDLSPDEHIALADARVELDDLLAQVMIEVGATDRESVLDAPVSIEVVLQAMATLCDEQGDHAAVAALNALALHIDGMAAGDIMLGDLFDLCDVDRVDGLHVDLISVIVNMCSLWNQHHAVGATTLSLTGDALQLDASVAEISLDISTVTPPMLSVGPDEIRALARHIEVLAHAKVAEAELDLDTSATGLLGAKLVVGNIDVCLFAPYIEARADVLDDENGVVMVNADVSRIHMCIGHPTPGSIGEGSNAALELDEVAPSVIGEIVVWLGGHEVPIARVTARAVASVEAHADALVLSREDCSEPFPYAFGPTTANLLDELMAHLEINVEPLGLHLSSLQLDVFQDAVLGAFVEGSTLSNILGEDLLEDVSLPAIHLLGGGLTSIDLSVPGFVSLDRGGDDGTSGDIDVDLETDTEIDVSVDDGLDLGADTDAEVGVDVDADSDMGSVGADVDADVDADIHVGDHGIDAHIDGDVDAHAEVGTDSAPTGSANGALTLAGGGCTASGPLPGSSLGGLAPLVILGLASLARARRRSARSRS